MKAYKVKISGTYRNSKNEAVDFQDIEGIIPFNEKDIARMHLIKRYASMWIIQNPTKFKERLKSIREVFDDEMIEIEVPTKQFSFIGKDIKKLNYEELQDLACAKDLRRIPLYKKTGLRQSLILAYAAYSEKVLKEEIPYRESGFNFAELPSIILTEDRRKDSEKRITNEDMIGLEQKASGDPKSALSRDELFKVAKSMNIVVKQTISTDALYAKIYGGKTAGKAEEEAA